MLPRAFSRGGLRWPAWTPTTDPYSTETLLRRVAAENAELRELLLPAAQDLERLASQHPEHAERFLAHAMRLRRRLHQAGG